MITFTHRRDMSFIVPGFNINSVGDLEVTFNDIPVVSITNLGFLVKHKICGDLADALQIEGSVIKDSPF